jgi:hypothetical protein
MKLKKPKMIKKSEFTVLKISYPHVCNSKKRLQRAVVRRAFTISNAVFLALVILLARPLFAGSLLTRLEKSNYQQMTSSTEIIEFMDELARSSDAVESVILTQSAAGHPLGAILISTDIREFMAGRRASDKLTVMLIGSQHGNESAGAEALMILSREILVGELRFHMDYINFVIIPNSNPDGRNMKRRVNGNGVNLSTNFTILSEPESRAIVAALHRWRPEVVLDIHESAVYKKKSLARQGYLIDFEAQFEAANNPNVDPRIRYLSFEHMLPNLINRLSAQGLPAQRYISEITSIHQPITHGGLSLRNLRNMAGILGSFGFLVENRLDPSIGSYPTPKNISQRIKRQTLSIETFLQSCQNYREYILSLSRQVRLSWKHPRNAAPLYLSVTYTTDSNRPLISLPLRRLDTKEPVQHTFIYHGMVQSRTPLTLPRAYVIRANQKLFAELLDRHQIAYSTQAPSILAAVELRPVELPPEGEVGVDCKAFILAEDKSGQKDSFQPGDLFISLDQPARRLIPLLLEPRSSSSIFNAPEYCRFLQGPDNILFKIFQ